MSLSPQASGSLLWKLLAAPKMSLLKRQTYFLQLALVLGSTYTKIPIRCHIYHAFYLPSLYVHQTPFYLCLPNPGSPLSPIKLLATSHSLQPRDNDYLRNSPKRLPNPLFHPLRLPPLRHPFHTNDGPPRVQHALPRHDGLLGPVAAQPDRGAPHRPARRQHRRRRLLRPHPRLLHRLG